MELITSLVEFMVWFKSGYPELWTLLALMLIDFVSGCVVAFQQWKLNSKTSFNGMSKKFLMLVMVCFGLVIEPTIQVRTQMPVPISFMITLLFIVVECMSIIENAKNGGIPLPKALSEIVSRFNDIVDAPLPGTTQITVARALTVNIDTPGHIAPPEPGPGDSSIHIKKEAGPS